eukprot:TRINITY_DN10190_c0_g3_i1.p3 TRINITY_DN10190_c0_g3~~TRINITY_DN10190_c0_g3_i1.p3  ORF type:complete len:155 (-),score=32.66 TRINITY_DN10190_c0_g3_i1:575-1039(-)
MVITTFAYETTNDDKRNVRFDLDPDNNYLVVPKQPPIQLGSAEIKPKECGIYVYPMDAVTKNTDVAEPIARIRSSTSFCIRDVTFSSDAKYIFASGDSNILLIFRRDDKGKRTILGSQIMSKSILEEEFEYRQQLTETEELLGVADPCNLPSKI